MVRLAIINPRRRFFDFLRFLKAEREAKGKRRAHLAVRRGSYCQHA
jgi:hypothetical protein